MELLENSSGNSMVLHLINFDNEKPAVKNIRVSMKLPQGKVPAGLTLLSPDKEENEQLSFRMENNYLQFAVPELSTYDVCVVKFQ
jgi:hypothetical protein